MKRKNLTTAVVAGLAGIAGLSSISNAAINMNNDGVGQVLIYPYYTVNENADGDALNTLISIVNTTEWAKVVKVRFLEGKNSREVLDFNLYLSAYDVWTAALVPTVSTVPGHEGELSGKLLTSDHTCTSPNALSGQEFLPYFYEAGGDPISKDLIRSREGHFEVIEEGNFAHGSDPEGWVTHVAGTPTGCANVDAAWQDQVWAPVEDVASMSGGIFGSASIINVANGTDVAYNARAINGWSTITRHTFPGRVSPDLNDGEIHPIFNTADSDVFLGGGVMHTWWPRAVEAFSAPFMRNELYAEYELTSSIHATTSYVVTFPTKAYYVDDFRAGAGNSPVLPFTKKITSNGACEEFVANVWDQEEKKVDVTIGLISPPPPDGDLPVFCWEANVMNFDHGDTHSDVFFSNNKHTLTLPNTANFAHGWVNFAFAQTTNRGNASPDLLGVSHIYGGLPMAGFAVQQYVNGTLSKAEGTVLANYAGLFNHRFGRAISSGQ